MFDESYYFAASTTQPDFFGTPSPEPGMRMRFNPSALAEFGAPKSWPAPLQAPWTRQGLVVYARPTAVLIWPCRLWQVRSLENPFSNDGMWLRCDSLEVVKELPGWLVFGPHGAAVADVISNAEDLTHEQVEAIGSAHGEREWRTRTTFLERWRSERPDLRAIQAARLRQAEGSVRQVEVF